MTSPTLSAGTALSFARDWVLANADDMPGFVGAYTAGSINEMPDDAILPETSDIDVMVVVDIPSAPPKAGKFPYRDVLLEVTYLALSDMRAPEQVLAHYHLAAGLRSAHVLADPTGHILALQEEVVASFSADRWVRSRCEMARDTVVARLDAIDQGAALPERTMSWLFAAGGVPHILLVAGLQNPTVRRRYEAVDELLHRYGEADVYPELLAQIGARDLTASQVSHHLDVVGEVFDAASAVVRSPFPFGADISPDARRVAIGGSREMIGRGRHREAIFWIAATFTRCQLIFQADAPGEEASRWSETYDALLADLGVGSFDAMQRSADSIRASLSSVWEVAERIRRAATGGRDSL